MPYSDNNDLLLELSNEELINLSGGAGSINTDRTNAARNIAENTINSYLFGIYEVPFASTPDLIRQISIGLTIYYLYLYKFKDAFVPVPVIERKNELIQLLLKLKRKELKLENIKTLFSNNKKPIFNRTELNKLLEN